MESIDFKKILLRTSFGVMACDGHVHPAEIDELKTISTGTKYLEGIDIDSELNNITAEFNGQKRTFFQENFKQLADGDLSDNEKLIVIDVVLRMIAADDRIDENEAKFLRALKKRLDISSELISERFGDVPQLGIIKDELYEQQSVGELVDSFEVADIPDLELTEKKTDS